MTADELAAKMRASCHRLSPDAHAAGLAELDKPQNWNPFADALRRGQAEAVRFRAQQALAFIDEGFAGFDRKQAFDVDEQARWN